jgi:hypothetical protein
MDRTALGRAPGRPPPATVRGAKRPAPHLPGRPVVRPFPAASCDVIMPAAGEAGKRNRQSAAGSGQSGWRNKGLRATRSAATTSSSTGRRAPAPRCWAPAALASRRPRRSRQRASPRRTPRRRWARRAAAAARAEGGPGIDVGTGARGSAGQEWRPSPAAARGGKIPAWIPDTPSCAALRRRSGMTTVGSGGRPSLSPGSPAPSRGSARGRRPSSRAPSRRGRGGPSARGSRRSPGGRPGRWP